MGSSLPSIASHMVQTVAAPSAPGVPNVITVQAVRNTDGSLWHNVSVTFLKPSKFHDSLISLYELKVWNPLLGSQIISIDANDSVCYEDIASCANNYYTIPSIPFNQVSKRVMLKCHSPFQTMKNTSTTI